MKTRCVWKEAQRVVCVKTKYIRKMCSETSMYVLQQRNFLSPDRGNFEKHELDKSSFSMAVLSTMM